MHLNIPIYIFLYITRIFMYTHSIYTTESILWGGVFLIIRNISGILQPSRQERSLDQLSFHSTQHETSVTSVRHTSRRISEAHYSVAHLTDTMTWDISTTSKIFKVSLHNNNHLGLLLLLNSLPPRSLHLPWDSIAHTNTKGRGSFLN